MSSFGMGRITPSLEDVEGSVELPGSLCSHVEYTVKMGNTQLQHTSTKGSHGPSPRPSLSTNICNPVGLIENDIALALLAFPVGISPRASNPVVPP